MNYSDLTDEQKKMIDLVLEGKNVLVDACIGSGKTTTIQALCDCYKGNILYLTYNKCLKLDARNKIKNKNVTVSNYHGYAFMTLKRYGITAAKEEQIQKFLEVKPVPPKKYSLIVIDEYQDIEQEIAEMLCIIKKQCPDAQIVAVGDMKQKIYDKTTLEVPSFIQDFLGEYTPMQFTNCFRLSKDHAAKLGRIWEKDIKGINKNCKIKEMNKYEVIKFLSKQEPKDVLCLGSTYSEEMRYVLNTLEAEFPEKYNKETVYASIQDEDRGNIDPSPDAAIFTTYDASKGLERKICVIFDYTENYWVIRYSKPNVKYEIIRNVFLVAASRGKNTIVYVKPDNKKVPLLSEKTLSKSTNTNTEFKKPFYMSDMFAFKYKEDVEECYSLLKTKKIIEEDSHKIKIKSHDAMIDLSPCIGIYQEASFFKNYDIDDQIAYVKEMRDDKYYKKMEDDMSLDEKILYLTMCETGQNRYIDQVKPPFVTEQQAGEIHDRLGTEFSPRETVQVECSIPFLDPRNGSICKMKGRIDVLKKKKVYELKFVSDLSHEHFLQCACYVIALGLKEGVLWNVKTNEKYSIEIPNEKEFLDCVVKTITKGKIVDYIKP